MDSRDEPADQLMVADKPDIPVPSLSQRLAQLRIFLHDQDRPLEAGIVKAAIDRLAELENECFALAAGVCEHRGGDEYGNPICLKTGRAP